MKEAPALVAAIVRRSVVDAVGRDAKGQVAHDPAADPAESPVVAAREGGHAEYLVADGAVAPSGQRADDRELVVANCRNVEREPSILDERLRGSAGHHEVNGTTNPRIHQAHGYM